MFKKTTLLFLLCLVMVTGCKSDDSNGEPVMPQALRSLLDEFLSHLETKSIKRLEIDWMEFRQTAYDLADGSEEAEDLYEVFEWALRRLDDKHSFMRTASGRFLYGNSISCTAPTAPRPLPEADLGYVRVRQFGGSFDQAVAYAADLQHQISTQDSEDLKGWIVDLRNNGGGNMWPMLAGLSSLFTRNVVGYFEDPEGNQFAWELASNQQFYQVNPVELKSPKKIAVLLDKRTASSGEATAIAFKGQANTRFFGEASCGLSTANLTINLSDGSSLFLTTSYMMSRNRERFGGPVSVDQTVQGTGTTVQAAYTWLRAD